MAAKKGKEIRERHATDRIFNAAVIILSITTFIVIAYPLWFIVIASISNSNMVNLCNIIGIHQCSKIIIPMINCIVKNFYRNNCLRKWKDNLS